MRKVTIIGIAVMVALGAFLVSQTPWASALTPGTYLVEGNPNCANLYQATVLDGPVGHTGLGELGPLFGFKYDANPTGDVSSTLTDNAPWVVTNGPQDPNNSVSISNVALDGGEGVTFDWSATLGIDAVIVKAQNANAYVYAPEEFGDTGLQAPGGKSISHVEFCYDYELTAEKTAEAEYTRTYTWDITKEYDGEYWKFIGDPATTHDYLVSVDQTVNDSDFAVSGSITVYNPTPFAVTFSVDDFVDGVEATVTCDDYALAANDGAPGGADEEVCTYTASLGGAVDGTNTATITSENTNVKGAEATADYTFGDPTTIVGEPDINVSDTNGESWMASGDDSWTYSRDFTCPTDKSLYVDGVYSFDHENTATIDETGQYDTATLTVNCYAPVPSKDANTSYTRQYDWTITKDYDGEYWKFIGDPATTHNYKVSVDQEISEYDFAVAGTITVKNYNPKAAMTVSLVDSVGGTAATLDCGGTLVVPAATLSGPGEATCGYSAGLDTKTDGTNTATATLNGIGFDTTADYAFGDPTNIVGYPDINVTDTNGGSWSASGDDYWEYTKDFTCPTDKELYVNGVYTAPDHVNTATIVETGQSDIATVELTCYAPVISKDADGSYDEYHDWSVDKSVDPTSQSAFAGDTVGFEWTVTVNEDVYEENYSVTGQINVYNPAPMPMTVSLSDVLDDGTVASITGCSDSGVTWDGTNLYIPGGVTAICDYTASPSGGPGLNNFAAALPDTVQFKVQYPTSGGDAYFPTVTLAGMTVLDGTYDGWCVDVEHTIANNTWYNANVYSSYEDLTSKVDKPWNMDKVNWIVNQGFVYQPSPGCSGDYTYSDVQRAIWALIDDNQSTAGLSSWSQCHVDEILAGANAYGEGFMPVCGDYIAVVLEPVGGAQVIAIAQVTMIEVGLECPAENTATATLNDIDFSAPADIEWTMNVVHDLVTLDDDQNDAWPIDLTDGGEWTYEDSYQCSLNPEDYVDGGGTTYQAKIENLATLHDGDEFLDDGYASTLVDCYIPTIEKTAAGTYDERHEWDVEKTVTPLEQGGYPGDVLGWTWTVNVTEDVYEENFDVAGTITVNNPNPDDDLEVALSDELGDLTVADITGCTGGTYSAGILTVPAGGTAICNYEANNLPYDDDADAPDTNYATITLNGIDFTANATIAYTANPIYPNATLTDDEIGLNESLTGHTQAGSYTFGPFTGIDSHTCSSDRGDYFVNGEYTQMTDTIVNWAYVKTGEVEHDRDDATTTWTCDASFVDIYKTTNGQPADPTKDIAFDLYSGTTWLEKVSTLNNGANLQFQTALVPGASYTVCESPVPAGYTFEISVNGGVVLTYAGPPGEENPTGEIQCFNFTAEPAGTTVTFNVNNRYPGGAPRTPGYWKNWNRCSGGNQAETADKLNDYLGPIDGNGVFLLDDLLSQTIGDFTIDTCAVGVSILDSRDWETGKNMSNDAAYTLAKALLAARLNQDAGACVPDPDAWTWEYHDETLTFEQVLTAADTLLTEVGFDGTGGYLGPKDKKKADLRADALYLYEIIDDYNNSEICTGEPSH